MTNLKCFLNAKMSNLYSVYKNYATLGIQPGNFQCDESLPVERR